MPGLGRGDKPPYWVDAVGRRFYRYEARTPRHQIVCEGVAIHRFRRNRKEGRYHEPFGNLALERRWHAAAIGPRSARRQMSKE
jgi:hypothetical protein